MIIRLRSRDGLERIDVPEDITIFQLKEKISNQFNISKHDIQLSQDSKLLLTSSSNICERLSDNKTIKDYGFSSGCLLFLLYSEERTIEPAYKKREFECKEFGKKMTIESMMALQTRIDRQEKALISSVSFDINAANNFQTYLRMTIGFSIKRGGLLYGTVDDDKKVKVEFIYEPPQKTIYSKLIFENNINEETRVNNIASALGLQKVGWIFSQEANERDFIISSIEIRQIAAMQSEIGDHCVTAIVSLDMSDSGNHVHFEAYQCSQQCVKLFKEGWFVDDEEDNGMSKMINPKDGLDKTPVIVAGMDVSKVDNDFFLCPVNILDHMGIFTCDFPVENRIIPQSKKDIRNMLQGRSKMNDLEKLSDFHFLLYLSKHLDAHDMASLCISIKNKEPILEGYKYLIESIADIS